LLFRIQENQVDDRLTLVFFTHARSGPARRMESLLAHVARKERERVRLLKVDIDQRPDLASRFGVCDVPALVLLKDKHPVARIDGRSSAPKIERMLEPYLEPRVPAVA
jgi:thioredoxin 1